MVAVYDRIVFRLTSVLAHFPTTSLIVSVVIPSRSLGSSGSQMYQSVFRYDLNVAAAIPWARLSAMNKSIAFSNVRPFFMCCLTSKFGPKFKRSGSSA